MLIEARRRKVLAWVERLDGLGGKVPHVEAFLGELVGATFPEEGNVQLRAARQNPVLMGDRIRAEGRSTEGLDWRGALESGMLDEIRAGRIHAAKELLKACLSSPSA